MPFYGESSVSTEQQREKSEETVPEEPTNAGSLAPVTNVVASSSLLSPSSNRPQTSPSLVTEAGTSKAGSNSQQNDLQISHFTQDLITLQSEDQEPQRLTTTDPSTSSNNHVEPEAHVHEKPTESLGKEAEIFEEVTEPKKDGQICEDGVGELGKKAEISENVIKPENEIEVCEHVIEQREGVGIVEKCNEPRNGTDICEEVVEEGKAADSCVKGKGKELEICETSNRPCLESNIQEKSHPYSQGHANSSSRIMPFNQHRESSFPPCSDPSRSPTSEPEEQNNAESLSPQNVVASSSELSPTSDHHETSSSLVSSASNSQQKDFEGLRVTKHFIPLLSKVLQILRTQPLKSMTAEQVQFMEDASRDLSSMNFQMEWLSPYLKKARKCLSVVDRTKAISELELKMVEIEAQLQALVENKKGINEAKKALEEENEAIASGMDLNKPLYDD